MSDLFPTLEPPPGGRQDLRTRLRREVRREHRRRSITRASAALSVAALSALAVWNIVGRRSHAPSALVLEDRWVASMLRPSEDAIRTTSVTTSAAARGRQALLRLDQKDDDVLIYWIGSFE